MASEIDFVMQTEHLLHDISILKMRNLEVPEKICTEAKATMKEALYRVNAFEEGAHCQKSYGVTLIEKKQNQYVE